METSKQLLDSLLKTGDSIQAIIRNFKKDSAERKTNAGYFEERIRRLKEAWSQFEDQDSKLRLLDDAQRLRTEHEYFTDDCYSKIDELTTSYMKIFTTEAKRLIASSESKQRPPEKENNGAQSLTLQSSQHTSDNHQGLIRKTKNRMIALQRLLNTVTTEEVQPRQYYELRIKTINDLWNQIQILCDNICEEIEDPSRAGFNMDEFYALNETVQNHLGNLSVVTATIKNNNVSNNTPPPSLVHNDPKI